MLIDWFTVVAQGVNFLVLVWLLKRYLYRPILDAVAAREARIAARLAEADATARAADEERTALTAAHAAFEQARAARLEEATAEAARHRDELLAAARAEADALRKRLDEALRLERETAQATLTQRIGQEVLELAGQMLDDLADESVHLRMAARFLEHLRRLPPEERTALTDASMRSGHVTRVRSSIELPEATRQAFVQTLAQVAPDAGPPHFEYAPELVGGVELVTDGHRYAWTVADYLRGVEHLLREDVRTTGDPEDDDGQCAA